jgi:hypothetical protein
MDYRWENRALLAWNQRQPIPPPETDEQIAKTCMKEAAAALGLEARAAALEARLTDLTQDREALRKTTDSDREFFKQSSDKMVSALGEAAKKPAPSAVATATGTGTGTGTAKTESDQTSDQEPSDKPTLTVLEVNAGAPPPAARAAVPTVKRAAKADLCPPAKVAEGKPCDDKAAAAPAPAAQQSIAPPLPADAQRAP